MHKLLDYMHECFSRRMCCLLQISGVGRDKGEYALHHYTQVMPWDILTDMLWFDGHLLRPVILCRNIHCVGRTPNIFRSLSSSSETACCFSNVISNPARVRSRPCCVISSIVVDCVSVSLQPKAVYQTLKETAWLWVCPPRERSILRLLK